VDALAAANAAVIRSSTAGFRTPPGPVASNTMSPLSPAWAGKLALSRSNARWDSVPGSENVVTSLPPAVLDKKLTKTRAMIQATRT